MSHMSLIGEHHWDAVVHAVVTPSLGGTHDTGLVPFLIALIGTTISPFMQFFVQSAVVEKGVRPRDYHYTRVEVVASSVLAILIAMFITIATPHHHPRIDGAMERAARALRLGRLSPGSGPLRPAGALHWTHGRAGSTGTMAVHCVDQHRRRAREHAASSHVAC